MEGGEKKRGNDESPKISAQIELEAIKRQQIIITSCCQSRLIQRKGNQRERERECALVEHLFYLFIYLILV